MRELPGGTVTLLFTDIEGSTRLLQDLGPERYVEALSIHRHLLRRTCAERGGIEVEMQGDSFHFAFPTAGAATQAASESQNALATYPWPTKPIRVRMGMHTGEPTIADGLYAGLDVHRAARVMSVAHGGQILISSRTAEHIAPGLPLRDLGEHRLKDFAEPMRLYQLGDGEFPPPRSVEAVAPVPAPTPEPAQAPFLARKTVTLLFTDVSGSTAMGEALDPETTRGMMSRYFDEMRIAVESHGGLVEKFVGDAVMAVFGIPELHEDDALRAVRAANEMRRRLGALNEEYEEHFGVTLQVRAGLNTGEVVAGDPSRGEAFATGDAVNVAARLEQAAEAGEILIGAETYRLVRDAVEAEPMEPLVLKGKSKPVDAWRLLTVVPHAPGLARRLDSPLVGREREVAALVEAVRLSEAERGPRLMTVLGAPGSGKSRLAAELLSSFAGEAVAVSGTCLPYGEGITFWPVAEMVRSAAGISDDDGADELLRKLESLFPEGEDRALVARRIVSLFGAGDESTSLQELFWAVRRLFEALAAERPLIAVFDDLHWAEPPLLDLIEYLLAWSSGAPIVLLCLARQELLEDRPALALPKPNATSILLEPLGEESSHALIENLLSAELDPALEARVTAAAEGNPLFVEELLRMLIDDGSLVRRNGTWAPATDLHDLSIPPTIHALLAARLERLAEPERGTLQRAAVIGRTFWLGAISRLSPDQERSMLAAYLQTLVRKELVRPDAASFAGEDAFRFGHILVREASYQGLPKRARAELHELFADWLEEKAGERIGEFEEILGYHLEQAYMTRAELAPPDEPARLLARRAVDRLRSAGRRAMLRGDVSTAANLLGRAATLMDKADPGRVELMLELAEARVATGDLQGTTAALDAAAEAGRDPVTTMHVEVDRLYYRSLVDPDVDLAELERAGERALPVFESAGDEAGLAKAWRLIAEVHLTTCRWEENAAALERAREHAERADLARERLVILTHLANAYFWGSTPVDVASERLDDILESARGHQTVEANVLCYLGGLVAMQGHFDDARDLVRRGRGLFAELGNRYGLAAHAVIAGQIELLAGDPEGAALVLRSGYESFEEMGETGVLSTVAAFLAEALLDLGREDEAARFAAVSEETASADDAASQILSRVVRARLLARGGDAAGARDLLASAATQAAETDFLDLQGKVWTALAELGESDAAARAVDAYVRKGNTVAAAAVDAGLSPR